MDKKPTCNPHSRILLTRKHPTWEGGLGRPSCTSVTFPVLFLVLVRSPIRTPTSRQSNPPLSICQAIWEFGGGFFLGAGNWILSTFFWKLGAFNWGLISCSRKNSMGVASLTPCFSKPPYTETPPPIPSPRSLRSLTT